MIIQNQCDPYKIRIALTEVSLATGYFYLHGIGVPEVIQYTPYAELVPVADGGSNFHGFPSLEITWTNPNPKTLYKVKKYVDDALVSTRLLYLTIPKNDGSTLSRSYIDVSGVPIPFYGQEQGRFGNHGVLFNGFTLKINNLTIINNPASY